MARREWEHVRARFHEALARGPEQRGAFLREIGAVDESLARELTSLLAAHADAGDFLDRPAARIHPSRRADGPAPASPTPASSTGGTPHGGSPPLLEPGSRLGAFEIVEVAGRGGMGEVYRARDLRLDRLVAIKVIPERYVHDERARVRFEREARAISRFNHPHICTLHDVGAASPGPGLPEVPFLVMELLEGRTLAQRLREGPLPVREALHHVCAIADALAAAHEQGIVHRDLKPANIMLTASGVKLLDFGLAQLRARAADAVVGADRPARSASSVVAPGFVAGTLRYMSPEQLRGEAVDSRSDVFAFGVVLYEMVSGRPPFDAPDDASVIAAVLTEPVPPVTTDDSSAGRMLASIVERCLEKLPSNRWSRMDDVRAALQLARDSYDPRAAQGVRASHAARSQQEAGEAGGPGVPHEARPLDRTRGPNDTQDRQPGRRRLPRSVFVAAGALLGAGLLAAVVVAAYHLNELARGAWVQNLPAARVSILPPAGVQFDIAEVSPDGRRVAFTGWSREGAQIWLRGLDAMAAQPIQGTQGASAPLFWSPDSRSLCFVLNGRLRAFDTVTGTTRTIADEVGRPISGTWGTSGVILFDAGKAVDDGLQQVPASGGWPTRVARPDASVGDLALLFPHFLRDGRRFLYTVHSRDPRRAGVFVGSLDPRQPRRVLLHATPVFFAHSGHLLFLQENTIVAQRFDEETEALEGDAVPIIQADGPDLRRRMFSFIAGASGLFSASQTGVLVHAANAVVPDQFAWYDRAGARQQVVGTPGNYAGFALSPDATRVAYTRAEDAGRPLQLWTLDIARGVTSRVTFGPRDILDPRWSPDGRRLAVSSVAPLERTQGVQADPSKVVAAIDLDGRETVLHEMPGRSLAVDDWSSDNRFLLYHVDHDRELLAVPVDGGQTVSLWRSPSAFAPDQARFSPDGRWVAYHALDSGRPEVYVTRFPDAGERWQVSTAGGVQPIWRKDGRELYYLGLDGQLFALTIGTAGTDDRFQPGAPRALFHTPVSPNQYFEQYAADATGTRFLFLEPAPSSPIPVIDVVLNWPAFTRGTATR